MDKRIEIMEIPFEEDAVIDFFPLCIPDESGRYIEVQACMLIPKQESEEKE